MVASRGAVTMFCQGAFGVNWIKVLVRLAGFALLTSCGGGGGGVTQSSFDGSGNSCCTRTLGNAQVGSWICEHRRDAIANMVAFRKATVGAALVGIQTLNGDNSHIRFAREGKGFVAINRSSVAFIFAAATTLPDGSYCNVAADNYTAASGVAPATCSGVPISVAGGSASINLPANGGIAHHIDARP